MPRWCSTRFARSGAWNVFAVRETSTRMLNNENDRAIRPVRTPAMRTEYAKLPIRLMRKVRPNSTTSCASIVSAEWSLDKSAAVLAVGDVENAGIYDDR